MLSTNALDLLVCPICKGKLKYDREHKELICRFDRLAYPISQDIPMMVVESARKLEA